MAPKTTARLTQRDIFKTTKIHRTWSRTLVNQLSYVVAFSVAFFLLTGLLVVGTFRFTGDLFFQWNTEGTAVGFKVLLRPVSEGR